jgi:ABC-2 type transport system permease protein
MNKILIIIKREFLTRVKKKTFIVLTIAVPFLFAAFYAFMIWMMLNKDTEIRKIAVINESTVEAPVESNEYTKYEYLKNSNFDAEKRNLLKDGYYAVLHLPANLWENNEAELFSNKQVPTDLKSFVRRQISNKMERIKKDKLVREIGIPDLEEKLAATETRITLNTLKLDEESGEAKKSSSEILSLLGMFGGLIIYMFILMYCTQVMRGVIEEKSNRIVEVIISSVKPFQLMMGKIVGVALVGLLQFVIWIVLIGGLVAIGSMIMMPNVDMESLRQGADLAQMAGSSNMDLDQLKMISTITQTLDPSFLVNYLLAFLFYFIGGYLLYAALFAAIGAAVDNETETQQFMTPLMVVLAIAFYMGIGVMRNPESSMAFWASMVPFTSPIVMLVRLPFGVPTGELIASMAILVGSFVGLTWLSGKIYRIGILMYGKKVTYKELWKWIKYKN